MAAKSKIRDWKTEKITQTEGKTMGVPSYVVHDEQLELKISKRDLGLLVVALAYMFVGTRQPYVQWAQMLIKKYSLKISRDDQRTIAGIINRNKADGLGDHDDSAQWEIIAQDMDRLSKEPEPVTTTKQKDFNVDYGDD